ncbi:hypothetical protein [Raoultella ornithinolytica]|uniref:hypothetical protein n=1 Tax=Raoultella ornithinolytica TaxID=54291 RepID=UPI00366C98B2
MTNNQLTKEWLQNRIADMESTRDDIPFGFDESGNNELAAFKLALAAMDSEPVGKPFMYGIADPDGNAYIDEFCVSEDLGLVEDTVNELNYDREEGDELNYSVVALYRHAQPAPVVPAVSDDIGEIRVGRLPTMNQDDYPGLGDWWVQLRIGEDSDEVLARVYGATPQEANNRAEALACRAAMLSGGKP